MQIGRRSARRLMNKGRNTPELMRPEWRWLLSRPDSVWYSSVEIFRQSKMGDWGPVVGAVKKALTERSWR